MTEVATMKSKIRNDLAVTVDGVDLTTISKPEFYIRQANKFFQYTPEIVDEKRWLSASRLRMQCS